MTLTTAQYMLGAVSGSLVGLSLGLLGGGGSILAVPLMVYVVGVPDPHTAVGTSAFAVTASAALNLAGHAARGTVRWRCATLFATSGAVAALAGSAAGKAMQGDHLLALFALVMLGAGLFMRRGFDDGTTDTAPRRASVPRLVGWGGLTGAASGFFGIGGGFLIVPALIASTRMPVLAAVGSSLVAVTAFGLATGISYALSGCVDWVLAIVFIVGAAAGGQIGTIAAQRLADRSACFTQAFSLLIFATALYTLYRSLAAIRP